MPVFSTPAIMLRRIDYGDYDLIISFLTLTRGKISVIAKSAKKSRKRFQGVLELFSDLNVVCSSGRGKGLPVLQEASLTDPFLHIRANVVKTAYASYWAELINRWAEENEKQEAVFHLFRQVLKDLDRGETPEAATSILFQMRFLGATGTSPNLRSCAGCRARIEAIPGNALVFNIARGGLMCNGCAGGAPGEINLSKGTVKQLLWVEAGDLERARRMRFTPLAIREGLKFLEAFVPYHLGREPRSLKFLRQIRG